MKKQLFLSILLSLGVTGAVSAQGIFKVIASSGKTTKGGIPVKVGTAINSTDQITVDQKSYLGLSYAKGGTVQISKAGTYSAKDLETKLLASSKSATQKYADFIIGEVVKGNDANIHKSPYAYQNVTGSVERATYDIILELPLTTLWLENQYKIEWHKNPIMTSYKITLVDNFDEKLAEIITKETNYTLDFSSAKYKGLDFIKVTVSAHEFAPNTPNDFKSRIKNPECCFKIDHTYKEAKAKIDAFKKQAGSELETDASKQIEFAVLLEECNFLIDAKLAYEKAMKLEPENPAFQIAHDQFKMRFKIGEEPKEAKDKEKEVKKGE